MFAARFFDRGETCQNVRIQRSMRRGEPVHFGLVCGSCQLLRTQLLHAVAITCFLTEALSRRWWAIATAARTVMTLSCARRSPLRAVAVLVLLSSLSPIQVENATSSVRTSVVKRRVRSRL